eukprot:PhF_6_TR44480/c0_g1_i1/m.68488
MGGSKAKKPLPKKEKKKLRIVFDCPFCDGSNTIAIKIKKTTGIAVMGCRNCTRAKYETHVASYMKEIDVYSEWYQKMLLVPGGGGNTSTPLASNRNSLSVVAAPPANAKTSSEPGVAAGAAAAGPPRMSVLDDVQIGNDDEDGDDFFDGE